MKYSVCPDCGRKSVYRKMDASGTDVYVCQKKKCHFFFYPSSPFKADQEEEKRWKKENDQV